MKTVMQHAPSQLSLRVLLLRSGEFWVAQCLEFDIAAQGATMAEAQQSFARTFVTQALVDAMAGKQPFEGFRPAPSHYVEQYDAALAMELAQKLSLVPTAEAVPRDRSLPPILAVADVRIAA